MLTWILAAGEDEVVEAPFLGEQAISLVVQKGILEISHKGK